MKQKRVDKFLVYLSSIIILFGLISLMSASAPLSLKLYGSPFYILLHQIICGFLPGFLLLFLALKIPLSWLKKYSLLFMILTLLLTTLVFFPKIGVLRGGARRWIKLGPITFQPSEFLKISSIIYFSAWISGKARKIKEEKEAFIAFIILLFILFLVLFFQPDFSTLGLITAIILAIYFVSETPLWHNILIWTLFGIGFFIFGQSSSYRMNRILIFLNPEMDPLGKGYQIKQSLIAIGSGGIKGLGLGLGRQKFGFLPSPASDTIFSVIGEELGFLGTILLISLFILFFLRGVQISLRAKNDFEKLLSFGISFWIILQFFINVGSMIRIFPLTGIPLPFFSAGGSAIISELFGLGILLRISKNTT